MIFIDWISLISYWPWFDAVDGLQ